MGVGVGVGAGLGEGVGVPMGDGSGVVVGVGSGDVTVLTARSLISAGPFGVPRPVWVFAVAPEEELSAPLNPP